MTEAKITAVPGGWTLVEHGTWQVSVGPDGVIMLPRHLHPGEVEDFAGAVLKAGEIGVQIKADNELAALSDDKSIPKRRVMVTTGGEAGIPAGAVRVPVHGKQPPVGSIGRRGNRSRATQSQMGPLPAGTQGQQPKPRPPQPPRPRGRQQASEEGK